MLYIPRIVFWLPPKSLRSKTCIVKEFAKKFFFLSGQATKA